MYTVADYGRMLADEKRMTPYIEALRAAIRPGDVVVDIGTGTGIFALWACKLGASHVYAFDDNPAIDVAKRACKASGFGDRTTLYEALSTDVTLPEKADVVVGDLRGGLPFLRGNLESMADARARLLKPEGRLIPARDTLRAGLVTAAEQYDDLVGPYERCGFDMAAARDAVVNATHTEAPAFTAESLLTPPATWGVLEYGAPVPSALTGQASFEVQRDGLAHGWALWFDATLLGDIGFTNEPGAATPRSYGRLLAPLTAPVAVARGDKVELKLYGRKVVESEWLWGWISNFYNKDGALVRTFRQATTGFILRPGDGEEPLRLSRLGAIARRGLALIDAPEGQPSLGATALADQLLAEFADTPLGATARFGRAESRELVRTLSTYYAVRLPRPAR